MVGYASLTRTVTVMLDGRLRFVATQALTVGGALRASGVSVEPEDKVEPATWWPVSDGMIINVVRANLITLEADGKLYSTATSEHDLTELLSRWGLKLNDGDRLLLSGREMAEGEQLPQSAFISLELRRPVTVTIEKGDEVTEFQSSAATLGQALAEEGIELSISDQLEPAAETPLDGPISATVFHAQPLQIAIGDKEFDVSSTASTVGQALAEAGISVQGLDRSVPAEDQPLPADGRILLTRITEIVRLEQKTIPFETTWQQDPDAELGTTSVIQQGRNGVSASRVRTRYENGVEVSHDEEANRVLVAPIAQINASGGNIQIHTTVIDGVEIEYWAQLTVFVTSYSPCRSGGETCLYGTSSGLPVQKGVVGTYLDWYRAYKGGSIYVPGYGPAVFGDVGNYPDGRPWIDLAYTDADWVGWSQWVTIYFTTPVPLAIPYFLQ